ncbi:MAG: hypothetical protein CMB99_00720 [Flavobacteriaceae bacterium]|nr:hypothetical protein [Flavobacteriaceae bacterium]
MRLEARVNPRVEQRPSQRLEAALSKITRAILNLNGTQYATLSEPEVLDGDFEIEWVGVRYVTDTSTAESIDTLFAGAELNSNTVAVDVFEERLRVFAYNSSGNLYPSLQATIGETSSFSDGKIQRIRVTYVSGVISLYLNDAMILTATWNIAGSVAVGVVGARTDTGSRRMAGNVFSFRVWKDGDRNTGELVTDLRFDQSDTIYQRNYAVPVGVNLADSEPSNLRETWTDNGDGSFTAMSNGEYLAVAWSGVVAGKVYKISYDIVHHGDGGVRVINGAVSEPWDVSTVDGHREVYVTADSTSLGFRHDSDAHFTISNISIKEWSGAILQNTLPGDWEQITKKGSDDYWLGTENLVADEYFSQLGGFTKIGPNIWGKYGENTASIKWYSELVEGHRYQFKGETLWRDPTSPWGANMSANFAGNNFNVKEVQEHLGTKVAGSQNQQEFRINIESSGKLEIRTDHLKRYLEYAEGAI